MVDAKDVMRLRAETGAGVNDCKKALAEGGDFEKAKDLLRKWGGKIAEKKAGRETKAGVISCYLHPTAETARVGVMVQLNCETDFVARNPAVQAFAREIGQHVAAMRPTYLSREEVPEDVIAREKEIYREQVKDKPPAAQEKIIAGKLEKYFAEVCLLDQMYVRDNTKSVSQLVTEMIAKVGENMKLARFARFEIGG
jgi:elongation factor Ts